VDKYIECEGKVLVDGKTIDEKELETLKQLQKARKLIRTNHYSTAN